MKIISLVILLLKLKLKINILLKYLARPHLNIRSLINTLASSLGSPLTLLADGYSFFSVELFFEKIDRIILISCENNLDQFFYQSRFDQFTSPKNILTICFE